MTIIDNRSHVASDPYAQFELALQETCIQREFPILLMGWDSMLENFNNMYLKNGEKIHGEILGYDDLEKLGSDEILANLNGTFVDENKAESLLDNFFSDKIYPISLYFSAYDPADCEYCGSSNITAQIEADVKDSSTGSDAWQATIGFGCYGGDSFSGDKENCIAFLRTNFEHLIYNDSDISGDDKYLAKKFILDLMKFDMAIPAKLPQR